jgi:hypothetical protein
MLHLALRPQDRDGIFQRRRTTVNYTKPEVVVLGPAIRVIEQIPTIKQPTGIIESIHSKRTHPAYDLDE